MQTLGERDNARDIHRWNLQAISALSNMNQKRALTSVYIGIDNIATLVLIPAFDIVVVCSRGGGISRES